MLFHAGGDLGLDPSSGSDKAAVSGGNAGVLRHEGSLMCEVVAAGHLALLKDLLEHGLDPNAHDYDGRTGQHIAAATGQLKARARRGRRRTSPPAR